MRKPTMQDVARRAGVSRALVSLALSDSPKVSEASRHAIERAAEELGYRPNLMARTLASRRTMTIGVLLDDLHNPFYADVADGVLTAANEHGYRILLTVGMRRGDTERVAVETLMQLHVDGLILVSPRFAREEIELSARHVPIVVVGEPFESATVVAVAIDEAAAVRGVLEHLISLGHSDIAHVDGGDGAAASIRRESYITTMGEFGLGRYTRVIRGEFTDAAGVDAAATLASSARGVPTAIFAANDLIAFGLIDGLDDHGIRVPDDISIVGFDDVFGAASRRWSLTTVHQPREEMGKVAVAALLEQIEDPSRSGRRIDLPTRLVERRSTAPVRSARPRRTTGS